jgi:hypothetical protein
MFVILKPLTMRLPFVKNYVRVSQNDALDDSQDLEGGSGCSSSDFGLREKVFTLAEKPSSLSLFKRWLPWLLCFCLVISNIRLWIKLKGLVFDDAVYCKLFKDFYQYPEFLNFSSSACRHCCIRMEKRKFCSGHSRRIDRVSRST